MTRLGLYGGPRPPYGSFAGKVEAEEVALVSGSFGSGGSSGKYIPPGRVLLQASKNEAFKRHDRRLRREADEVLMLIEKYLNDFH